MNSGPVLRSERPLRIWGDWHAFTPRHNKDSSVVPWRLNREKPPFCARRSFDTAPNHLCLSMVNLDGLRLLAVVLSQEWQVAADIPPVQTWATLELEASCMQWSFFFCTLAAWILQGDRQPTLLKVTPCCLCFLPSELWVRSLGIARARKKWETLYQLPFNWKLAWSRPYFL